MVTNPVAVQTGLNNLVYFSTEIWMENPACNPVIYRQAVGRVDRIGQKKETRILLPVYTDTLQDKMYDLLMRKIAISTATDGLDPESALQAAGLGDDDYLLGLSIGKQLWSILNQD
jgi:SNF2 family DNA or RNA helicase